MTSARATHPADAATDRIASVARTQIRRDPWPDFSSFDPERYPLAVRRPAARQWWRRAREEYGSIHEFSSLAHALCELRAPIDLLAALSRLITDEARHASMCASMASALLPADDPNAVFEWTRPAAPWPAAPSITDDPQPLFAWAADVVLCACCIGEELSRPLFETLATVITDPVPEAVVRQILRDEHLHATFGWEALGWLLGRCTTESRDWLQQRLAQRLGSFERSCVPADLPLAELAQRELTIEPPGPGAPPNLGMLDRRTYAFVFYATLESTILPRFAALGFDAERAWRERPPR